MQNGLTSMIYNYRGDRDKLSTGKGNNRFIHKTNIHKYTIHTYACMHEVTHISMQAHTTLTPNIIYI